MVNGTQSQFGFERSKGLFDFIEQPVGAQTPLIRPLGLTGTKEVGSFRSVFFDGLFMAFPNQVGGVVWVCL